MKTTTTTTTPTSLPTASHVIPSLTSIIPYKPVDITCRSFQPDFEVNLWQESTPGTLIHRSPDGVTVIRQGNVFTITQGRKSDEGTYYCQAAGSQKIPAAILTFPVPGKILISLDTTEVLYQGCNYFSVFVRIRRAFSTLLTEGAQAEPYV